MPHPFFDTSTYPWSLPEARSLHQVLFAVFTDPVEINRVYRQSAAGLPPLALGAPPDTIWTEALDNLAAHTDALRGLCNQQFTNAQLQNAVAAVVNAKSSISLRITRDNVLVLDRVSLREKIELVVPETSVVKVLLVRGSTQSGKSHGRHVLHSAARDRGAVFVYIASGMVVTVGHVVERLFSAVGAHNEIPPTFTTDMAGYITVCFKLQSVALRGGKQVWIAVDDLGPGPDGVPLLSTEIREFFDQFALQMMDPSFSTWFRLMLIHYPEGKLPTKWKREILTEDRPNEADVQVGEVAEVLREWAEAHGRNIVEAELLELAADVMESAQAPPEPGADPASRLQRINEELSRTLSDLAKQKP